MSKIPLDYNLPKALEILENLSRHYSEQPFLRRCAVYFGQPQKDDDQESIVYHLTRFVKERVRYVSDPIGFELVTAPDVLMATILEQGVVDGDCDDHVLLLNTLLQSVGIETKVAAVQLYDPELFDHVITLALVRGQWLEIDPCAKSQPQPAYPNKYTV